MSLLDPLLPLLCIVFLAFSVCFSPYPFHFIFIPFCSSYSQPLLISISFIFIPFCSSYSQPLSVSFSFLFSLLFSSSSQTLFLLISIRMLSFISLSLSFSHHIFICMPTIPSILLLVFLRMSANCTCSTCLCEWQWSLYVWSSII